MIAEDDQDTTSDSIPKASRCLLRKYSGMAITMTMALFSTAYPEAVLPAIVSTIVETAWFAVMPDVVDRVWPAERGPDVA